MTQEQRVARAEREGILIYDAGCSEGEARYYCNCFPDEYGVVDIEEVQGVLL